MKNANLWIKAAREWMGYSASHMGRSLDVSERTIRNWEAGTQPVPAGAVSEVEEMVISIRDWEVKEFARLNNSACDWDDVQMWESQAAFENEAPTSVREVFPTAISHRRSVGRICVDLEWI